ncbi:MAG: TIM barrel protein [Dehalococcoidia bacterium]|nr:TIM barrel protein [Dehalococcoidia bacterium]
MAKLLFGTAGIPLSTWPQETGEGIRRVAALGLDCMELEFVQGIYLNEAQAKVISCISRNNNVSISAHAPYYLNFNAHESHKLHASQGMLYKAAHIASLCGAKNVVFHPGFYLGDSSEKASQCVQAALGKVVEKLKADMDNITLRPESAGKPTQFGSIDELIQLSCSLENVAPCIDFAHWHARTGNNNSYGEFCGLLDDLRKNLGEAALSDMHIHISGIEYGKSGEKKHLPLTSSDLRYEDLLRALKDYSVGGCVICESPTREEDALLLKEIYQKFSLPPNTQYN